MDAADKELLQHYRISNSFTSLVAQKYAQKRLSEYKFDTNMNANIELEMLTTAFVVAYVRLHEGGKGSGFSRDILPEHLRSVHDESSKLGTSDLRTTMTITPFQTRLASSSTAVASSSSSAFPSDTIVETAQNGASWSASLTNTPSKEWKRCSQD
jgi:hypothetical protein